MITGEDRVCLRRDADRPHFSRDSGKNLDRVNHGVRSDRPETQVEPAVSARRYVGEHLNVRSYGFARIRQNVEAAEHLPLIKVNVHQAAPLSAPFQPVLSKEKLGKVEPHPIDPRLERDRIREVALPAAPVDFRIICTGPKHN